MPASSARPPVYRREPTKVAAAHAASSEYNRPSTSTNSAAVLHGGAIGVVCHRVDAAATSPICGRVTRNAYGYAVVPYEPIRPSYYGQQQAKTLYMQHTRNSRRGLLIRVDYAQQRSRSQHRANTERPRPSAPAVSVGYSRSLLHTQKSRVGKSSACCYPHRRCSGATVAGSQRHRYCCAEVPSPDSSTVTVC